MVSNYPGSVSSLQTIDVVVIGIYFGVILIVGLVSSYRSNKTGKNVKGYFLASRNMHWVPVGASLFASNIGSGHFIGLAGSGAATGIGVAAYELSAVFTLMVMGWIFVPVYVAAGVYTMPEYLRLRFGGQRIRIYLAVLALLLYVFTKISADLYSGALFMQLAFDLKGQFGLYLSIVILLSVAALFTIVGGLVAVIWTDLVQTVLMLIGACVLMILSFEAVGGYPNLVTRYAELMNNNQSTTCNQIPSYALNLVRGESSDLPWTGLLSGLSFTSVWYFCSDQVIIQRALAARNSLHAKAGCLFAGLLKLTPLFLMVFPGMASRILFPDKIACSDPEDCFEICGSRAGCTNIAYPELVIRLTPSGMSGLMLAVMLSSLMTSLTSIFNSSSTVFTIDIWTRIRSGAQVTETELLIVGRISVLILVVISVLWIPILQAFHVAQLFVYIQQVQMFLAPPIAAVYILAIFWKRSSEKGAFCALMTGLVMGIVRFFLEFAFPTPVCGSGEDNRPAWIKLFVSRIHYLHFAGILGFSSFLVMIVVSLLSKPINPDKLHRLTFWTRHSNEPRSSLGESTENVNSSQGHENKEERSCCFSALVSLCCLRNSGIPVEHVETVEQSGQYFLHNSCAGTIVNAFAVGLAGVTIAIWAYYA